MNKEITEYLLLVNNKKDRISAIELLVENELPVSDLDESKMLFVLKKENSIIGTGGLEIFDNEVSASEKGGTW